jgi:hypothetical protein
MMYIKLDFLGLTHILFSGQCLLRSESDSKRQVLSWVEVRSLSQKA